MDLLYYWTDKLPDYASNSGDPATYFKSLIYKDDRFSAIFESYQDILNRLNGVSSADIGFEFQLYRESNTNTNTNSNVVGIVLYVKPGTPAATAGIKRGYMFRKINGKQITTDNYSELINNFYDSSASATITFASYSGATFTDLSPITLAKVTNYQENPVYLDSVYTVQNKKIGYLVYNFFTNDPGDDSYKYDLELNNAIAKFKQQNISELIVDLRYNGGGMVTSAIHLGSMLVPSLSASNVFTYTEYNKNYTDYFNSDEYKKQSSEDPFVDKFVTSITAKSQTYNIQNVGNNLQRIFFLTGSGTASASEMVINGLKPYLPCILIGETTVGKNVGSTLVHDEDNSENQWAMLPIILKYFNKNHESDFTNGFTPDYKLDDDYTHNLGDTNEALLAKALSVITGNTASAPALSPRLKVAKSAFGVNLRTKPSRLIVTGGAVEMYKIGQNKMKKNSQIIMISGFLLFSSLMSIGQTQRINTRQPVLIDNRSSQKIAEHELKAEYASVINRVPDLSENQRKQILKIESARNMRLKRINIEIERNKTLIKQGKADMTEIKAVISKLSERKQDLISISNNKIKAVLTPAQIRKAGM